MSEPIIVSFSCANSEFAAKLMTYFDKLNEEIHTVISAPVAAPAPAPQQPQYEVFTPAPTQPPQYPTQAQTAPQQSAMPPQGMTPPPMQSMPPQGMAPAPMQGMPPQGAAPAPMQGMPPQGVPSQGAPTANFNQAAGTASAAPQYQQQAFQYDPIQTMPNNVPSSRPAINKEDLLRAVQLFSSASDANREIVRQTLARFSVDSFTNLNPAAYNDFAAALREKGARI